MNSNPDTPKVFVMGVIGLLICAGIIYVAVSEFLSMTDNNNVKTATEEGSLVLDQTDYVQIATTTNQNSDWQQTVNEYVYDETEVYSFNDVAIEENGVSGDENVSMSNNIPDLSGLISDFNNNNSYEKDVETNQIVPVLPEVDEEKEFYSLGKIEFDDCGSLSIPSGIGLIFFSVTAGENPAVVCLGESVVRRCNDSRMQVNMEDSLVGEVYVTERPDGVCAVGASSGDLEIVSLCSIEKIMNSNVEDKKSFKEWQKVFKEEPGSTFASMYFDNSSKLSDPALASQFDCEVFKLVDRL